MGDATCSEEGCDSPVTCREWCNIHYQRHYRKGPLPPLAPKIKPKCSCDDCDEPGAARGWCAKHYARWRKTGTTDLRPSRARPVEERFWTHVDKRGPDECWPWTAFIGKRGWGHYTWDDSGGGMAAHRMAYTLGVGPIPDGMQIDHMCHDRLTCQLGDECPHRRCCNPAHLEPATNRVNSLRGNSPPAENSRKTECDNGHEYTPENTYYNAQGCRRCRTCELGAQNARIHTNWERGLTAHGTPWRGRPSLAARRYLSGIDVEPGRTHRPRRTKEDVDGAHPA